MGRGPDSAESAHHAGGAGAESSVPILEQHFAPNVGKGMEKRAEEIASYAAGK
jgi:hypothetical protein